MRKFAAFDIDGTIFRSGLYREVVYELLSTGKAPQSLMDEFAHHEADWKARRSHAAFSLYEHSMANAFDKTLPGIKCADFDEAAAAVFARVSDYVYAYTRDLARSLKADGYTLVAISGSQSELVKPFAEKYGFDIWMGQHYERGDNGYFTGNITKTHDGKDVLLKKIVEEHGLDFSGSVAVGDSRGDIGMLSIVEQPIAFNPERELFEKAREEGWRVVVERKNMIYELHPDGNTFVLA